MPGQSKAPKSDESFSNVENFERMILDEIRNSNVDLSTNLNPDKIKSDAMERFSGILNKFTQTPWFQNSAFKQHATLSVSYTHLTLPTIYSV